MNIKLVPFAGQNSADISLVPPVALTLANRALWPYPPANIKINGSAYTVRPSTVAGDLTIQWSSRNKSRQTSNGTITKQDDASIAMAADAATKIILKIAGSTIRTVLGLIGEKYKYTAGQRIVDDADLTKVVTVQIIAYRPFDSLENPYFWEFSTVMTGGAGVGGFSGILSAGDYSLVRTQTALTNSGTVSNEANATDANSATFAELQTNGATADAASLTIDNLEGSSASAATLKVDFEITQNDLTPAQPGFAWIIQANIAGVGIFTLATGNGNTGPLARGIVSHAIPAGVDFQNVVVQIRLQCSFLNGTGAVIMRVYEAYVTTI